MKKYIISFIYFILTMMFLHANTVKSIEKQKQNSDNYCVTEQHFTKKANSDTWLLISSRITKYYTENVVSCHKLNVDNLKLSKVITYEKSTESNIKDNKPYCSLNTNSELIINFNSNKVDQIQIFDILGNLILQANHLFSNNYYLQDFSRYSAGCYYIRLITTNKEYLTLRFVKI